MVIRLQKVQSICNVYPLSEGQKDLWFIHQSAPANRAYNEYNAIKINSSLKIEIWKATWQQLIQRHSILRTTYGTNEQGEPIQIVHPTLDIPTLVIDASDWHEEQLKQEILACADIVYDLEQGPIIRLYLFQRSPMEWVQLLTLHHIANDSFSKDLLLKEFKQLYEGQTLKAPVAYSDFVSWESELLKSHQEEHLWHYWEQQLAGELPMLDLPTDRPHPSILTYRGDSHEFQLDEGLISRLRQVQFGNTGLFQIMLTAFYVLLHRYSHQEDILVHVPIENRRGQKAFEEVVGYFVSLMVLRINLEGNPTFKELLLQVAETIFRAMEQEAYYYPFAKLVKRLKLKRDLSRHPVTSVMFNWRKLAWYEPKCQEGLLQIEPYLLEEWRGARYDLTVEMIEVGHELHVRWNYNTDLFNQDTIKRMIGHYLTVLEAVVADPEMTIAQLPLLTEFERYQLLVEWNNTQVDYPKDKCIHQLFEAQVEKTPDAVAVVFEEQQLTYQELNYRANQLAHYLQKLGVKPESLVGISLERSLEMVIGLLGILKAGGAYVPLDPNYPREYLEVILEDSEVSILLTQDKLGFQFSESKKQLVLIDTDCKTIFTESITNPINVVSGNNCAYIIYTSGSTGKPKGAAIEHRNTVALIYWAKKVFTRDELSGVLASTSICFDLSVFELFVTLSCGGKVILAENALQLPKLPAVEEITLINTVPSVIAQLVNIQGIPQRVQTVNLAGEPLKNQLVQQIYQQTSVNRLYNLYGPSEDTTYSTFTLVEKGAIQEPTIGRPISNSQAYLLDHNRQPVPIGVVGELYMGGDGVARGYINRPDLNTKRFLNNPFKPDSRMYKTGDLACYLPEGNIKYLGRIDNQVKIRGFRIELGEIENTLEKHFSIKQALVIAQENTLDDKRLVAYIVSEKPQVNINELRQFLNNKLPNYMVPSTFVILESLPLTPNGKVDHRALPAPEICRSQLEIIYVQPQTKTEKIIAQIWQDVLKLEKIGIYDNFFELGGHSLIVVQLVNALNSILSTKISVDFLLNYPTIAALARQLDNFKVLESLNLNYLPEIVDLKAEAVLDSTIQFSQPLSKNIIKPTNILLTGATGFIGAYLLNELLKKTSADIYCLIRDFSVKSGREHLKNHLKFYSIWDDSYHSRIIPIVGDLAKPLFSLPIRHWKSLADQIEVIYHNGAWVNYIYPYSILKAVNVLGTQEILRLASHIQTKPVHFISTSSIFSANYNEKLILETDNPEFEEYLCKYSNHGYCQSKWVAERLVTIAKQRGLPACIYRLGTITAHSKTGIHGNEHDFFLSFLKGCIQLEVVPKCEGSTNLAPIDYVSQALVYLSLQNDLLGGTFHLYNPQNVYWNDIFNIIRKLGYKIKVTDHQEWLLKLKQQISQGKGNALSPFLSNLKKEEFLFSPKLSARNTLKILAKISIICPPINEKIISNYLEFFMKT